MQVRSLEDLQHLLGSDSTAVQQLQRLFQLAQGYGYQDWLVFDASVVRGLAYYTGLSLGRLHMLGCVSHLGVLECMPYNGKVHGLLVGTLHAIVSCSMQLQIWVQITASNCLARRQ